MSDRRITKFFAEFEPPEGVRAELLRGEIVLTVSPDLAHNRIVAEVQDQIPHRRWERLQTQDVDIIDEASEPVPDLVVLERGVSPESGRLLPCRLITLVVELVVEVVSKTSVDRDYGVKRSVYAAGKVPAYLIVDPVMAQCVLLTEPQGVGDAADYQVQRITKFGDFVPLDLLDVELDTGEFATYENVTSHRRP